jgi:malonyl-CoA/methylmalonyl-CoA synthetase
VHILGRGKDLVISGGFNVYPKEIESEIDAMPGVIESAVIGVPHADFGEGHGGRGLQQGRQRQRSLGLQALDGRLAKFKMPEARLRRRRIAAQRHGKVQKNILRDTYAKIYAK